jgi:hypothetical protein
MIETLAATRYVTLKSLAYLALAGGAERGESFDLDLSGDLCVVDSHVLLAVTGSHPAGRAATAGTNDDMRHHRRAAHLRRPAAATRRARPGPALVDLVCGRPRADEMRDDSVAAR